MSGSDAALAAIASQLGQVMGVLEKQVSRDEKYIHQPVAFGISQLPLRNTSVSPDGSREIRGMSPCWPCLPILCTSPLSCDSWTVERPRRALAIQFTSSS